MAVRMQAFAPHPWYPPGIPSPQFYSVLNSYRRDGQDESQERSYTLA